MRMSGKSSRSKTAGALMLALGAVMPVAATAQSSLDGLFTPGKAGVAQGPYLRFELGTVSTTHSDGHWLPPGYPTDPRIDFDLRGGKAGLGGLALGYDWKNGFRVDVGLIATGNTNATGPHTTPGAHADITSATVSTTAVMGNLYYAPLEKMGRHSRVQPFLVAGLGYAENAVSDWTRTNAASTTVTRTFSGATTGSLAWSLGIGMSIRMTPPGKWPALLELAYRHYGFGTAKGGAAPLTGTSTPVEPLTFRNEADVFSISVRVPLDRR